MLNPKCMIFQKSRSSTHQQRPNLQLPLPEGANKALCVSMVKRTVRGHSQVGACDQEVGLNACI